MNRQFAERLKNVFLQTMQNPGSDGSSAQKKSSSESAEKITGLWVNAKLFEKGFKLFDGKKTGFENMKFYLQIHLMFVQCQSRTHDVFVIMVFTEDDHIVKVVLKAFCEKRSCTELAC